MLVLKSLVLGFKGPILYKILSQQPPPLDGWEKSFSRSAFQKVCVKTLSSGNGPFVMSQGALTLLPG